VSGGQGPTVTAPTASPASVWHQVRSDFLGYSASLGVLGLGSVALLPVLTQGLSASQLGALAVIEGLLVPASTLGMMGLKFAFLYRFARSEPRDSARLLATCLGLGLAFSALSGLALLLAFQACWVAGLFGAEAARPLGHAWLLPALVMAATTQGILMTDLRARRSVRETAVVSYAQLATTILVCWYLVARRGAGLDGYFGGQLAGNLLAIAWVGARCWRAGNLKRAQWAESPALARYGAPLAGALLIRYGMDTLARVLLALFVSVEAAGEWLIVGRIVAIFEALVGGPFMMAWGGLMHQALQRPDAQAQISRVAHASLAAGTAFAGILVLLYQPLLVLLSGEPKPDSYALFALLLANKVLEALRGPWTVGIQASGATGWALRNNAIALGAFAVLAPGMVALGGAQGLAGAILLCTILATWLLYREARQWLFIGSR
jgi:O-antigen/teichoic acid export membrane protein